MNNVIKITLTILILVFSSKLEAQIKSCYLYTKKNVEATAQEIERYERAQAQNEEVPFTEMIYCVDSKIGQIIEKERDYGTNIIVGGGGQGTSEKRHIYLKLGDNIIKLGEKVPTEEIDNYQNQINITAQSLTTSILSVAPDVETFSKIRLQKETYRTIAVSKDSDAIFKLEANRNGFNLEKEEIRNSLQLQKEENRQIQSIPQLKLFEDKNSQVTLMVLNSVTNTK